MILLGIILILLGLALGAVLVLATQGETQHLQLDQGPISINVHPLWLVVGGALAMLLVWWGWAAIRGSARRKVRTRKENKELERQAAADRAAAERAEAERARVERDHPGSVDPHARRERFDDGATAEHPRDGRFGDRFDDRQQDGGADSGRFGRR